MLQSVTKSVSMMTLKAGYSSCSLKFLTLSAENQGSSSESAWSTKEITLMVASYVGFQTRVGWILHYQIGVDFYFKFSFFHNARPVGGGAISHVFAVKNGKMANTQ